MKPEPLDGKKVKGIMYEEPKEYFYPKDVKSAVEGLKQELTSFMEKNPAFEMWVYRRVVKMIKKWFKDVIE
ncbi:MAG: hypothetical protein ACTSWZ_02800 [Candidatus Heimdallarchaeaceae archaeon]